MLVQDILSINSVEAIAYIHVHAFLCSKEPNLTALLKRYAPVNVVKYNSSTGLAAPNPSLLENTAIDC